MACACLRGSDRTARQNSTPSADSSGRAGVCPSAIRASAFVSTTRRRIPGTERVRPHPAPPDPAHPDAGIVEPPDPAPTGGGDEERLLGEVRGARAAPGERVREPDDRTVLADVEVLERFRGLPADG